MIDVAFFANQVRSDALKLRRTPFFVVHAAVPLAAAAVFLAYLAVAGHAAPDMMAVYLQILAIGFPLVAAWVSGIVTDQETDAGGGFFLLVSRSRGFVLASKIAFMAVFGLASCCIAVLVFACGAAVLRPDFQLDIAACLLEGAVLWAAALFLYLFHTWLGLRFGRNANFAMAAFEMLLAALMITGLGETVWFVVPSAWPARLVGMVGNALLGNGAFAQAALLLGAGIAAVGTMAAAALLFWWIRRWEGRKNEEG